MKSKALPDRRQLPLPHDMWVEIDSMAAMEMREWSNMVKVLLAEGLAIRRGARGGESGPTIR